MIVKRPVSRLLHAFSLPLTLPMINDITTTPENPPEFLTLRKPGVQMAYPERNRDLQREAYPDLAPLQIPRPAQEVFELVKEVAATMPDWQRISELARDGALALQYVAVTPILKLRDDVVIEVKPEGASYSSVHLRSKSRIGRGDLGKNAQRIRVFLRALKKRALKLPASA